MHKQHPKLGSVGFDFHDTTKNPKPQKKLSLQLNDDKIMQPSQGHPLEILKCV